MKSFNLKKILFLLVVLLGVFFTACGEKEEQLVKNNEFSDSLKLEYNYDGLSFLNDGIGEVTLYQTVDGDTAHFRDKKSGANFTARFLCINTPESTGRIDPWGKAASAFVASKLKTATTIVCESKNNGDKAELDTTGKRYLAYIWYKASESSDFRLLNLELVEEGYTKFTDVETEVKYGDVFQKAHLKSYKLGIRDYGEKDPDYDYLGNVTELTIAELKKDFDSYTGGSKLKITARIMRIVGDNLYLQDLKPTEIKVENENGELVETGEYEYGSIYMFSGYGSGLGRLEVGKVISFECQCVVNETYGNQLTNPKDPRYVNDTDEYYITELDGSKELDLQKFEGFVVSIEKLKVKSVQSPNEEGAYTIYCETLSGQEVNVRVDGGANPKLVNSSIEVGKLYDVIGGVSKFNETYQIMMANQKGVAVNDFVLSE